MRLIGTLLVLTSLAACTQADSPETDVVVAGPSLFDPAELGTVNPPCVVQRRCLGRYGARVGSLTSHGLHRG